jgi:hypothetical protein
MITLHVGPDATRFDVHGTILYQSEVLAAKFDSPSFVKQQVPLPNLDESTAHTLVHYLYTSRYQSLRTSAQTEDPALQNYKLGTCVYCAAVQYRLPGLADLAKDKITSYGEDVSITQILGMARDHAFPVLPSDETWYSEYLQDVIKRAMADDPEPFRLSGFVTQVEGNSRLLQVVWKTVMSNFAAVSSTSSPPKEDITAPVAEAAPTSVSANDHKTEERGTNPCDAINAAHSVDESPQVLAANDDPARAAYAESATTLNTAQEDLYKLDDIEPTVRAPHKLEPFTDEVGFEKSKMYQMAKVDTSAELQTATHIGPDRPGHKRSDSVMKPDTEKLETVPLKAEADETEMTGDVASLVVNGSGEAIIVPKKTKKGKKKKSSICF